MSELLTAWIAPGWAAGPLARAGLSNQANRILRWENERCQ
jgi:hypothetical protein